MGIERFLVHRVSIVRQEASMYDGEPVLDDYGQPVRVPTTIATAVPAGIQPKSVAERAAISQAGAATATHTIYMLPRDITTADAIVHSADDCPMTTDLPDATYEVRGVPDAAGAGHHLQVDAFRAAAVEAAYATPVGS